MPLAQRTHRIDVGFVPSRISLFLSRPATRQRRDVPWQGQTESAPTGLILLHCGMTALGTMGRACEPNLLRRQGVCPGLGPTFARKRKRAEAVLGGGPRRAARQRPPPGDPPPRRASSGPSSSASRSAWGRGARQSPSGRPWHLALRRLSFPGRVPSAARPTPLLDTSWTGPLMCEVGRLLSDIPAGEATVRRTAGRTVRDDLEGDFR